MKASQTKSKEADLVLRFGDVDRSALPIVGGKAANLGELIRAGLPVPAGFCVTTAAYETRGRRRRPEPILEDLAQTHAEDTERLAELAAAARSALLAAPVPPNCHRGYRRSVPGARGRSPFR